jgi:Cd2+/Zn2+-exporting ATPase
VNRAPKTAFVKLENKNIPVNKVTVGTIIQVKPGEMIPLDGKIISGETTVDEAAITGEPIPKDKRPGAILFAGTLNKMVLLKWKLLPLHRYHLAKIIRLTLKQRHLEVTHRNSFSVSLNSILLA